MKKTYIIPQMQLMVVDCESLIADSVIIGGGTTEDGGWVKQDVTSTTRDSYNVWGDDWSK